jgi:toxin ParE1/3/4
MLFHKTKWENTTYTMKVDWSRCAREDLDDLYHYIARDSAFYAKAFLEHILKTTKRLNEFPLSGRKVPEADNDAIREVIVYDYRVMYRVESSRVLILAVMHGS